MELRTLAELVAEAEAAALAAGLTAEDADHVDCDRNWYGWKIDPDAFLIYWTDRDYGVDYWIDLDRCLDSANVLDWIFQLNEKTWCDPECLKGLVNAFVDLIGREVAGWGQDHPVDIEAVAHAARCIAALNPELVN